MKRSLSSIALIGFVVFLASCSGDSSDPGPLPTPAAVTWGVSSVVSDSDPYVGSTISVTATVTRSGSEAPDGTAVEFIASGGVFLSASGTVAEVATEGGAATALFGATEAADYVIQARVGDAVSQVVVSYREYEASDNLQIYLPLVPGVGALDGGEQVTLHGKGIVAPAEVYFTVDGVSYQAVTVDVQNSDPLSADGSITVQTPAITGADPAQEWPGTVRVDVGVGTTTFQTTTLTSAFTFLQEFFTPEIYVLVPDHGSARGGEQVMILGRNFQGADGKVSTRALVARSSAKSLAFGVTFDGIPADELAVSPDGAQIVVTTPQYTAGALTTNESVAVAVEALGGTVTKDDAFVYVADEPTPVITALEPVAGPLDGGTRVTVFGRGFQFPVQVMFGDLEAEIVNVFDDTTAADNDEIICVSPDYSQQPGLTPPVTVEVTVRNIETGNVSDMAFFVYGDNLFISGNTPTEGRLGTLVTIYGSGFEDPLHVDFGTRRLETIAVSGTEIIARFPDDIAPSCVSVSNNFTVTLIESDLSATGGRFTLLGNTPIVTGVSPVIVQSDDLDNDDPDHVEEVVNPTSVTILGVGFTDAAIVTIGPSFVLGSGDYEVVDDETILITNLPAPGDFNLTWDMSDCTTALGATGLRRVATPVSVTVTNFPGDCADTLSGAIVYQPGYTVCEVGPVIDVTPLTLVFNDTEATQDGSICDTSQQVTVTNTGDVDINWAAANQPDFTAVPSGGSLTIGSSANVDIFFCPVNTGPISDEVTFTVTAPSGGNSEDVQVFGNGIPAPFIVVNPTAYTYTFLNEQLVITIDNSNGTGDLVWSAALTNTGDFSFVGYTSGTDVTVGVGQTTTVTVQYVLDTGGLIETGTVNITHDATHHATSPIAVSLTGLN